MQNNQMNEGEDTGTQGRDMHEDNVTSREMQTDNAHGIAKDEGTAS